MARISTSLNMLNIRFMYMIIILFWNIMMIYKSGFAALAFSYPRLLYNNHRHCSPYNPQRCNPNEKTFILPFSMELIKPPRIISTTRSSLQILYAKSSSSQPGNTNNDNKNNKYSTRNKNNNKNKSKQKSTDKKSNKKNNKSKKNKPNKSKANKSNNNDNNNNNNNLFSLLSNPYQAGKTLRENIDSALTSFGGVKPSPSSPYYLDDTLLEPSTLNRRSKSSSSSSISSSLLLRNTLDRIDTLSLDTYGDSDFTNNDDSIKSALDVFSLLEDEYIPEVLVVGATGGVGRLVVQRLLLDGRFRVRVLVRNLYSSTLNTLGTKVTYCQGDLNNMESLEYALTDVDKIVFCAGPPKQSNDDASTTRTQGQSTTTPTTTTTTTTNLHQQPTSTEFTKVSSSSQSDTPPSSPQEDASNQINERVQLAEQIDSIGMQNLVRAYQNVRHADYGTSQAAKRSLFKFGRLGDFEIFRLDQEEEEKEVEEDKTSQEERDREAIDYGSTYDQSTTYDSTSYDAPAYDAPAYDAPAYDASAYDASAYDASAYDESAYDESTYDTSYDTYNKANIDNYDDASAYNEPTYSENTYSENTYNKQTKSTKKRVTIQQKWIKNKFNHGVFRGGIKRSSSTIDATTQSSCSIISERLQSRQDPEKGISLKEGFAGFLCRVCSDGKTYQAFVRTSEYKSHGIEYVYKFNTSAKIAATLGTNKSKNKFVTVRLPFSQFRPVSVSQSSTTTTSSSTASSTASDDVISTDKDYLSKFYFDGTDVQHIGFRFSMEDVIDETTTTTALKREQTSSSTTKPYTRRRRGKASKQKAWVNFYLALSYIKVYRTQPEPEFIYLSDAAIPASLTDEMIRYDLKRIVPLSSIQNNNKTSSSSSSSSRERIEKDGDGAGGFLSDEYTLYQNSTKLFDEQEIQQMMADSKSRTQEETYFKYRGEEILKKSGLSYTIVRYAGINDLPSGEFNLINLQQYNRDLTPVSRAEIADVCVNALLDPNARNLCFYMTKAKRRTMNIDDKISSQFVDLNPDS